MKNFKQYSIVSMLLTLMVLLISYKPVNGQIISQYIETNSGSYPKGIEIWNETGGELDFSMNTLAVLVGVNGGVPSSVFTLSTGTLAVGDVIVIGTTGAPSMQTITEANGSVFHYEPFSFNGDDALIIKFGGTITDVFGTSGVDPGSAWDGNGVSTANQNIQLKTDITTGDTDGWTDPSERFETVSTDPVNDMTGFGIAPGSSDTTPPDFSSSYPKSQNIVAGGFDIAVSLNEPGTAYFVVLADGATAPSATQVKAGTDANDSSLPATSKGSISVSSSETEYSGSASSLTSSTAYDVYVIAEDDADSPNIQSSPVLIEVTTASAASAPSATTGSASSVLHNSARVNGTVNANNASTTVTFEYGTTTSYGSSVTATESPVVGSSAVSVSADISDLSPSTEYHFRVKAVNSEGTSYGSDATFTTSSAPVAPTSSTVYISEVSEGPNTGTEFIELYNNSNSLVDLSNTKLIMQNDGTVFDIADYSGSQIIPSNGFIIIARGATQSTFESDWGVLPSNCNYNEGSGGMYFSASTARQWVLKDGGTTNTDDGTLIDDTQSPVAGSGNRSYQQPIGVWTTQSYSGNSTPGTLDNDQSLPVTLSRWEASSKNGLVQLSWTTDSEIENLGFIIERALTEKGPWRQIADFNSHSALKGQGSTNSATAYSLTDEAVAVGETYYYRLSDVDYKGTRTEHDAISVTVSDKDQNALPGGFQLEKIFPNPFNPSVTIDFTVVEPTAITVNVFDLQGRLVQALIEQHYTAGNYQIQWNGLTHNGQPAPSGIYLLQIRDEASILVRKVILAR